MTVTAEPRDHWPVLVFANSMPAAIRACRERALPRTRARYLQLSSVHGIRDVKVIIHTEGELTKFNIDALDALGELDDAGHIEIIP